jgi:ribonuclease HII
MPVEPTLEVEAELFRAGATVIIGLDEVGRGALAGPVMVGACVVTPEYSSFPPGLRDSKLISEKKRELIYPLILEWAPTSVGESSAEEIDEFGITHALGLAAKRSLTQLHEAGIPIAQATILLDGSHDWLNPVLAQPLTVITRVKADQDCAVVSAASVVAKVTRDRLMSELHLLHPHYNWESNKGYGAAIHMDAISSRGTSDHHRKTWVKDTVQQA